MNDTDYNYIPDGYWGIWPDNSVKMYEAGGLGEYLAEFSSAPTPTMDLGAQVSIKAAQFALNKLGFKGKDKKPLKVDGAGGANTQFAMNSYITQSKKKYPSASVASDGAVLLISPSEVGNQLISTASMSTEGRALLAAKPSAPVTKTAAKPVAEKKNVVAKPGAKAVVAKPGAVKKTVAAKAAPKAVAKPVAARVAPAKAVQPSKTGLSKVNVGTAQDILNKLGAKLKRDGLFGANTAKAWATAAKARKLAPAFDRAGPMEAWADPKTIENLSNRAGANASAAATAAPPPSAEPTPVTPPVAAPSPAAAQLAADQIAKQATSVVPVLMLQQAELMANKTPAQSGRYEGVTESGTWDDATDRGFYILFAIKAPYDDVWKFALPQLVNGDLIRVLPNQASTISSLAKLWVDQKNKPEPVAAPDAPAVEAAAPVATEAAAPSARAVEVVSKATTILPVKVLQQALRQLYDLQQSGRIPARPAIPLPQVTGSWRQGADDVGLFIGWGAQLYPYGVVIPTEDKDAILSKIVFTAPGLQGLRGLSGLRGLKGFKGLRGLGLKGLRGFGDVPDGNAIKLPPEVISNIQSLASDYVAKTANSAPAVQSSGSSSLLLPTDGSQVALEPQLITGQVPQQTAVPQAASAPVYAPLPYQDQIQAPAPIMLTPNYPTPSTNYFTVAPNTTITVPAAAPSAEPSIPAAANLPTPGVPELPSAMPAVVAAPAASSSGGIGLVLGLIGVGTLAFIAMKGKDAPKGNKKRRAA